MEKIQSIVTNAVKDLFDTEIDVTLTRPDEQYGDYATNVALQLAGKIGKNPRDIANELKEKLTDESIARVEVAGPGFLNITLTDQALLDQVSTDVKRVYEDDSVVIETNNPNPFKAMHIGHAFNAILGDTLANLIERGGAETHRVSYHGDVGTHVGRSMYSLLKFVDGNPDKLNEIAAEERNAFMSRMYAEGSKAAKENDDAKSEIEELAKQSFTRENPVYAAVYDTVFAWSFEQIDANVARLGNRPVEYKFLESAAEEKGIRIVQENTPEVFQESDGALVFKGSEHGSFDNAFVSSKGTGLYASRDLGLIELKEERYHPDKSFIVTAEEQRDYFKGVIAAAELCDPNQKDVTVNISTGTVKLSTGKMSSRDGDVLDIAWLFDQISEAVRNNGGKDDDAMVASALRYEFLKVRIGSDVVFDVNQAVSIHGNSGPYLQYAHARARSIASKAGAVPEISGALQAEERTLVRKLSEYTEAVDRAILELLPHHVCTYLHELAQVFNRFYEHNRVIGDERESVRLAIVSSYANILKDGLELLGIHAPDSM